LGRSISLGLQTKNKEERRIRRTVTRSFTETFFLIKEETIIVFPMSAVHFFVFLLIAGFILLRLKGLLFILASSFLIRK